MLPRRIVEAAVKDALMVLVAGYKEGSRRREAEGVAAEAERRVRPPGVPAKAAAFEERRRRVVVVEAAAAAGGDGSGCCSYTSSPPKLGSQGSYASGAVAVALEARPPGPLAAAAESVAARTRSKSSCASRKGGVVRSAMSWIKHMMHILKHMMHIDAHTCNKPHAYLHVRQSLLQVRRLLRRGRGLRRDERGRRPLPGRHESRRRRGLEPPRLPLPSGGWAKRGGGWPLLLLLLLLLPAAALGELRLQGLELCLVVRVHPRRLALVAQALQRELVLCIRVREKRRERHTISRLENIG